MKKFYAFAAAALLATAANAQTLYVVGAGEGLGWTPDAPYQVEPVDGAYTFEIANLTQFKISKVKAELPGDEGWGEFNGGTYGCAYGEEPGVEVALEAGWEANIETPWKGDWTVVIAGDLSTIKMTTETPKPADDVLPEIYVRGDMNSWGVDEAWKLEALSKTLFKLVLAEGQAIQAGESWKIADADWNKYNVGGSEEMVLLDSDYEVFNGGNPANMQLDATFENGVLWLGLDIEGQNWLYLSTDLEYVPDWAEVGGEDNAVAAVAVANDAPVYFNLQGVRVANPANGIYVKVAGGKALKTVIK